MTDGASLARSRGEAGTALVEVTWLSILLLVPLLYIVLAVFEVQRSAFAVTAAARSAGRAYTTAPSETAALEHARAAAAVALGDQNLDLVDGGIEMSCSPDPTACLTPGSVVRVHVSYPVPLPLTPTALGANTPGILVEAVHSIPYGTFREAR